LAALHDAAPETTVTIAAPFVAYLGAEHLEGSGVLAVLTLGLFLRSYGHPAITARGWLLGRSVWDYADFVITSLVFVLVGFELTTVIEHSSTDASTVRLAIAVIAAVVVFRPLWLFPAVALAASRARRRDTTLPYGWRETGLVSWAGMRGVVTVATALALPSVADDGTPLVWRESVVLVGLGCVLVTLVVQGLTLTPLVRALGVGSDVDEATEVRELRLAAMRAAIEALRAEADASPDPAWRAALTHYEGRLKAHELVRRTLEENTDGAREAADLEERLESAWRRANDVERELVLDARARGTVTPAAADEVLHDIEVRAARTGP
jgi:CPA1 family monovalent cation:H+ antiporter